MYSKLKTYNMKASIEISLDGLLKSLKEDGHTHQESLALMFTAAGKQADEVADEMYISTNTARMHIKNSKDTNGLSKSSALSGYVICKALGVNYEDVVKQLMNIARSEVSRRIISGGLLFAIFFGIAKQSLDQRYYSTRNRRIARIETRIRFRRNFDYEA